ncbi:unnamed protein product [Lathyrus oleraceus]
MAFMICMEREKTRESAELLSLESLFIESVDIVSFGILVLEIISGQKFVAFFISRVWKIYLAFTCNGEKNTGALRSNQFKEKQEQKIQVLSYSEL